MMPAPPGCSMIVVPSVCTLPAGAALFDSHDDDEVQAFIAEHFLDFSPYSTKLTAWEIFAAARKKFGDKRCLRVSYFEH